MSLMSMRSLKSLRSLKPLRSLKVSMGQRGQTLVMVSTVGPRVLGSVVVRSMTVIVASKEVSSLYGNLNKPLVIERMDGPNKWR